MALVQHAYRRGVVWWWRRNRLLSDGLRLDVRVSLRTIDRRAVRDRGAVLTAATGEVTAMLNARTKDITARLTESEVQSLAKQAYEERLGVWCFQQRKYPHQAAEFSRTNLAMADFYDRLASNGGRREMEADEEQPGRRWDLVPSGSLNLGPALSRI